MKRLITLFLFFIACFSSTVNGQVVVQVGTGTSTTTTTTASPVNNWYNNYRMQILYTVAELNALGITGAQSLDQIGFNVIGLPVSSFPNYTIKIKHTTVASLVAHDAGPFTTVYTNALYTATAGWNMMTFTTPWTWNGCDNILVDICWDFISPSYTQSGTVQYTTASQRMRYFNADQVAACPSVTGTNLSDRPNTKFRFASAPPCSGTPTAGTLSANLNCPISLATVGSTLGAGLVWHWQYKTPCDQSWIEVVGADCFNYYPPIQSGAIEYRAYVVCTSSGMADTTNSVSLANVPACYCASGPLYNNAEDITKVALDTMVNITNCLSLGGGASILNIYNDYTTLVNPVTLVKGATVPLTIQVGVCNNSFTNSNGVTMFIDYNNNGTFDASERVFSSTGLVNGGYVVNGLITVPVTAQAGITRMRVVNADNLSPSSIPACANNSYYYGETEDYLVKIVYAPTVTGDTIYCSGDSAFLTVTTPNLTGPATIYWVDAAGVGHLGDTISYANIDTSKDGVYAAYAITTTCGGTVADTSAPRYFHIHVNETPPTPTVSSTITYCQNAQFDSIVVYGQNIQWYDIAAGGSPIPPPVVNTAVLGTSTFYVSQTSLANCESALLPVTVTVSPQTAMPTVVSPITYCQGAPAQPLQATGNNLLYYTVPTGGVGTSITPTPNTFGQGTFVWYVSQTENGCESDRVPIVVTVNYTPNAYISVTRPYVCQYDTISVHYFGNAIDTASYTWTVPTGATILSGEGQGPLVIRFDSAGTRRVHLQVDNGGCAGPLAYVDIDVRLSPRYLIDLPTEVCQGEIATLAVNYSTPGIDQYTWDFDGGINVFGTVAGGASPGPFNLRWDTPGMKIIKSLGADQGDEDQQACLSLPVDDTIIVRPLPVADIYNVTGDRVCAGDSIRFEAYFDPLYSYQWLPQGFFDESSQAVQWGKVRRASNITLNVTSQYNCRATDSVFVNAQPCCDMAFPNAFSPNGDRLNDIFRSITPGNHDVSFFRIQNRWGQTVYEAADASRGWDGTFGGKPQDIGTYFYYIKYLCGDGKYYEKKGEVTLVR